jgi:hypothetical protein
VVASISLEPDRGKPRRNGGEEDRQILRGDHLARILQGTLAGQAILSGPINLPEFQMSVASFQSLPAFCHTTTFAR